MIELLDQSGGYNESLTNNDISEMKEIMYSNIHQQEILSKMMEQYNSQRSTCIDKYIGWFLHLRHLVFRTVRTVPIFANIFA